MRITWLWLSTERQTKKGAEKKAKQSNNAQVGTNHITQEVRVKWKKFSKFNVHGFVWIRIITFCSSSKANRLANSVTSNVLNLLGILDMLISRSCANNTVHTFVRIAMAKQQTWKRELTRLETKQTNQQLWDWFNIDRCVVPPVHNVNHWQECCCDATMVIVMLPLYLGLQRGPMFWQGVKRMQRIGSLGRGRIERAANEV